MVACPPGSPGCFAGPDRNSDGAAIQSLYILPGIRRGGQEMQ
jgi:hypothetical protein